MAVEAAVACCEEGCVTQILSDKHWLIAVGGRFMNTNLVADAGTSSSVNVGRHAEMLETMLMTEYGEPDSIRPSHQFGGLLFRRSWYHPPSPMCVCRRSHRSDYSDCAVAT